MTDAEVKAEQVKDPFPGFKYFPVKLFLKLALDFTHFIFRLYIWHGHDDVFLTVQVSDDLNDTNPKYSFFKVMFWAFMPLIR